MLNVQLPDVYLLGDNKAADIQLANAIEKNELCPSFVVRPHLLQGKTEREIAFLAARRLTFMRPEYYLRMLLPTNTELKVALLSAIVMVQPQLPGAAEHGRHDPAVPAQDAEAHAAARARAAGRARTALHSSHAGDRHGEVGPRGRCRIAPGRLRDVR